MAWLWHGYLATGNVTLLTGPWKCGKTTLLAALLSRLGTGGALVGLPVAAARAVVVTKKARGTGTAAPSSSVSARTCAGCAGRSAARRAASRPPGAATSG